MSKPYLITYDLNSPGQNYDKIIELIKGDLSTAYCTYWKSSFLIRSNYTPQQIVDTLKKHFDKNDRFLVIEVSDNYSGWLTDDQWKFIKESIFNHK